MYVFVERYAGTFGLGVGVMAVPGAIAGWVLGGYPVGAAIFGLCLAIVFVALWTSFYAFRRQIT